MKRLILILLAVAALSVLAFAFIQSSGPEYPQFKQDQSGKPEAVLTAQRDYAYHIGDLVFVDLFVHQPKGTQINPGSLSIDGDFELREEPEVSEKAFDNGSIVYHLRLELQSFKASEELKVNGSINYRVDESVKSITLNPLSIYTSRTWDGRTEIMQGDDPSVSMYWIGLRYVVPLGLAAIVYLGLLLMAIRKWMITPKVVSPSELSRKRVISILTDVKEESCESKTHLELDALIRTHWGIGPVPADELPAGVVSNKDVVEFLKLNAIAVYSESGLDETQSARLVELGNRILQSW